MGYKKAAILSIFCGIWEIILGAYILLTFVFCYFDIGGQYEHLPILYSYFASNLSWFVPLSFIVLLVSFGLFISGGVFLFKNKSLTSKSLMGGYVIYTFYACLNFLSILLASMSKHFPAQGFKSPPFLTTLIGSIFVILPIVFLQRMLKR